jgi:hypothetical protein
MKKYAFLSLLAVLALGACDDDDDPTGNNGEALVRVVNATTVSGATVNTYATVGLYRGNDQLIGGVGAGGAASCQQYEEVPEGNQTLHFRASGSATQVASVTHNFVEGKRYTIVLMGHNNTTGLQARVFEDEALTNAPANQRRIRFINASTAAGNADVYAVATATTAPGATAAAAGLTPTGSTTSAVYVNTPNTNNAFRFYNAGGTTTERFSYTIDTDPALPASNNATLILTTNGVVQVNACS